MNCPKCSQELIEVNGKYLCVDCGIEVPVNGELTTAEVSVKEDEKPVGSESSAKEAIPAEETLPAGGKVEVTESLPADGASDKDVEAAVTAALSEPPENSIPASGGELPATTATEPITGNSSEDDLKSKETSSIEEAGGEIAELQTELAEVSTELEPDLGLYQDPMYDMSEIRSDSDNPQPLPAEDRAKTIESAISEPEINLSKNEQKIDSKKEETGKLKNVLIIGIALVILLAGSGITAYFFLTGGK